MMNRHLRVTASLLLLAACVPVPPEMLPQGPGSATSSSAAYPDVEPGSTSLTSLHFTLRGYSDVDLRRISQSAEDTYNRIGLATGLYSYLASQMFTIVVYKDVNEYATKTKQPVGSMAIASGTSIYTYGAPNIDAVLAHQLMHLIFNSYMGNQKSALNWLNEGLAMHAEVERMTDSERISFQTAQNNKIRTSRMPLSQMVLFVGNDESKRKEEVWYLQTESVVSFLLKQGTSLVFAAFLSELRNGADLDRAISNNYSGKFRGLADFESSWSSTT